MKGDPSHFETYVTRLGLQTEVNDPERVSLVWHGGRFPGWMCLGVAGALLILSIPIVAAIRAQGWNVAAGSLWYFPVMNLGLFCLAFHLLSLQRRIVADRTSGRVLISKRGLWGSRVLSVEFSDIESLKVGIDQVYSGLAVAGSTAGRRYFPTPSLRLVMKNHGTVLLDRGSPKGLYQTARRLRAVSKIPIVENENETFQQRPDCDI